MKKRVNTSISLNAKRRSKFENCARLLGVDKALLLSALCYKAGKFLCNEARNFQAVEYQQRGEKCEIMPVSFLASDHEFMLGNRLACKISVSKLLALAIDLFLEEIAEKGINPIEIAFLHVIQNSYEKKSYLIRNYSLKIINNDQFQEFSMKMRMAKT